MTKLKTVEKASQNPQKPQINNLWSHVTVATVSIANNRHPTL